MKLLLLLLPLSLIAAQQSKPIDVPKRKVNIFTLPRESDNTLPLPDLKSSSPTPNNAPETTPSFINWDVLIEGKIMRIKLSIEPAEAIEKKDK